MERLEAIARLQYMHGGLRCEYPDLIPELGKAGIPDMRKQQEAVEMAIDALRTMIDSRLGQPCYVFKCNDVVTRGKKKAVRVNSHICDTKASFNWSDSISIVQRPFIKSYIPRLGKYCFFSKEEAEEYLNAHGKNYCRDTAEKKVPVITVSDIKWSVDNDEIDGYVSGLSPHKGRKFTGREDWIYMTPAQRRDCVHDAIRHNRLSVEELLDIPTEIHLPTCCVWDDETVSDYISDTTGFCHEGFSVSCNIPVREIKARLKELDGADADAGTDKEKAILENILVMLDNNPKH